MADRPPRPLTVRTEPVYVRRRRIAGLLAIVLLFGRVFSARIAWDTWRGQSRFNDSSTVTPTPTAGAGSGSPSATPSAAPSSTTSAGAAPKATGTIAPAAAKGPGSAAGIATPAGVRAPTPSPARSQGAPGSSGETVPVRILSLSGNLASKSVDASSRGLVFAQNMMYQHSMAAFGPDGALLKTIPDSVDLSTFGITGHPGVSKGAPVEMAFSPDGAFAWVSNYHMYGQGFSAEPSDTCTSGEGFTHSYVYKVDTATYRIVKVIEVGVVPKYVAMTPDGKHVVVTNWCSMDITVIDTATDAVVATVPSGGRYPRGIAISKDSGTAYIALMGSGKVIALDLASAKVRDFARPGSRTRHLTISPDGSKLYATNSGDNNVVEMDARTGAILRTVKVGAEPRSMTVSTDGGALYVVNYNGSSMSKIRTSDFTVVATVPTDGNPIGITYEPTKKAVWVACYSGTILVFDDSRKAR